MISARSCSCILRFSRCQSDTGVSVTSPSAWPWFDSMNCRRSTRMSFSGEIVRMMWLGSTDAGSSCRNP